MTHRDKLKKCFIKFFSAFGVNNIDPLIINEYLEEFATSDPIVLWNGIKILINEEMELSPSTNKIKLVWVYYHKALKNSKKEATPLPPAKDDPRWATGVRECQKIREMLAKKMTMPERSVTNG